LADNVTFQSSVLATPPACFVVATDCVGGAAYQIAKIAFGANNTATQVNACNPLPITGAVTNTGLTELAAAINCNRVDVSHGALTELAAAINCSVLDVCVQNASLAVTNAGLTELAAAIASCQVQVDIAAISGVTFPVTDNCGSLTVDNAGLTELAAAINCNILDVCVQNAGCIGGGTQYTEGCTDASITGTAILWEAACNTLSTVNASAPLPVSNAGLTELAAAINGCQVDVDIKATDVDLMLGTDFSAVLGTTTLRRNIGCVDPLNVAIVDASGCQVVCFGGSAATQTYDAAADFVSCCADSAYALAVVRDDALGGLTPAEGDYVPMFVNADGALWVSVADACGNQITCFGGSASSHVFDSAADFVSCGAHTAVAIAAVRDNSLSTLTPAEGDYVPLFVNTVGALWVESHGGTVGVCGSCVIVSSILGFGCAQVCTQADNIANTHNSLATSSLGYLFDGSTWDRWRGDACNGALVNLGTNNDVTINASSFVFTHDSACEPTTGVIIGGIAQNTDSTAPPNRASAECDAVQLSTTRDGAIFALPHGPQIVYDRIASGCAQTNTEVFAAPGAGLGIYVTDFYVSHDVGCGSAEQTFNLNYCCACAAVILAGNFYLGACDPGFAMQFQTPLPVPANKALRFTSTANELHAAHTHGYIAPA
jgi:hypothetical protein